ncbi:MAG TPA: F0F1 ATP synthase subunit alpha, partial [Nitrospiria bacterium]|nr:F0F1 ATP synthase subunit alpha [Nitrospiria bacterium]
MAQLDKERNGSALARRSNWIKRYRFGLRVTEQGSLVSIGDGIAWIKGLPTAAMDEILQLEDGSRALVFYLAQDSLGAILLQQT